MGVQQARVSDGSGALGAAAPDESFLLDDNRYFADVLYDFK